MCHKGLVLLLVLCEGALPPNIYGATIKPYNVVRCVVSVQIVCGIFVVFAQTLIYPDIWLSKYRKNGNFFLSGCALMGKYAFAHAWCV